MPEGKRAKVIQDPTAYQDVKNTIFRGRIRSHELVADVYRHRVKGKTVDGEAAECVVEIGGRLVIVTVFLVKK